MKEATHSKFILTLLAGEVEGGILVAQFPDAPPIELVRCNVPGYNYSISDKIDLLGYAEKVLRNMKEAAEDERYRLLQEEAQTASNI